MAQKPSIPKGTRDFGPAEMAGRNYIFDTIRSVFKCYGYAPIETPAMENLTRSPALQEPMFYTSRTEPTELWSASIASS